MWFGSLLLLLLHAPNSTTFAAEVVAERDSLHIPGAKSPVVIARFLELNDDLYALLAGSGVIETDSDFRQVRAYKFDDFYSYYINFVRIDGELHVVGQLYEGIFVNKHDIHVLRYGESTPLKTWRCGNGCGQPMSVNFFDFDNPVVIWGNYLKKKQYVQAVQLGTDREWRFDSVGFSPSIRRIGSRNEAKGLQDIFIDLIRIESRGLKAPERVRTKTIRLSDLNLLEEAPKHLNDYEGVSEVKQYEHPMPGYQARSRNSARTPRSHFHADLKAREASVGIHRQDWIDFNHGEDDDGHHWWKVKTRFGIKHTAKTWYPNTLNCRTAAGEPFDSYLLVAEGGTCWRTCGSTIYELRTDGYWREVYHNDVEQYNYDINLKKKDEIHVGLHSSVVRLDRGIDYCVEDLREFQPSLP